MAVGVETVRVLEVRMLQIQPTRQCVHPTYEALDRAIAAGASRLVVAWSAFWWLDYYAEFARSVRSRFPLLLSTERVQVFDLTPPVPRK